MILFCILALILLILAVIVVAAIGIGGAGFIVIFGDVIVCMVFIALLIKFLMKRRK
jgi:hypothetical protein